MTGQRRHDSIGSRRSYVISPSPFNLSKSSLAFENGPVVASRAVSRSASFSYCLEQFSLILLCLAFINNQDNV